MFYQAAAGGYREVLDGVTFKTLVHGERTLLSEFRLEKGAIVPLHAHPQEQTGYLVSGALRFSIAEETILVAPGGSWNLPSGLVHGAEAVEDSLVIEVFAPPREDYLPAWR